MAVRCRRGSRATTTTRETSEMQVTTVGLDLAKNLFQVHGADGPRAAGPQAPAGAWQGARVLRHPAGLLGRPRAGHRMGTGIGWIPSGQPSWTSAVWPAVEPPPATGTPERRSTGPDQNRW